MVPGGGVGLRVTGGSGVDPLRGGVTARMFCDEREVADLDPGRTAFRFWDERAVAGREPTALRPPVLREAGIIERVL